MGLPCGTYNVSYAQDMAIVRTRWQWVMLIAALVLLFTSPLFLSAHLLRLTNLIGITAIVALGLGILTGYTGQISIGQAAFMAVGAYTSAILVIHLGFSFWLALPLAGLSAGIVGLIFGTPSLRVKGFYLVMATLAAQFIIPWLIVNAWPELTLGCKSLRVPAPILGGMMLNTQKEMFYVIMPIVCLMTLFAKNLARTRLGRAFVAIRDNDLAAGVTGINIFRYKLFAFFICSFYAGIGGALWAHWIRAINVDQFTLMHSIWFLGMIIVGGMSAISGIIMGVAFIQILKELTSMMAFSLGGAFPTLSLYLVASLTPIVFGLVVLLFIVFEPRGLHHLWETTKVRYRIWPYSY